MCPITHFSYTALIVAIVASFVFGFIWYGPLFGKTWAQLMGFKIPENCKDRKPEAQSLILTFFGVCLTVFVLAYLIHYSRIYCSFGLAFLVWLGFLVPALFSQLAWEGRPLKLFILNAAYHLLNLQLIAAVLTHVR